jgi:hypothetical protein
MMGTRRGAHVACGPETNRTKQSRRVQSTNGCPAISGLNHAYKRRATSTACPLSSTVNFNLPQVLRHPPNAPFLPHEHSSQWPEPNKPLASPLEVYVLIVVEALTRAHHLLSSGKAPRKQLASKAARKTAAVSILLSSSIILLTVTSSRTPPVVSRSPIVSAPEPSPSVKSVATRSRPSSSSGSSLSNVSSVKSRRISRYVFYSPSSSTSLFMVCCVYVDRSPFPILRRHGSSRSR